MNEKNEKCPRCGEEFYCGAQHIATCECQNLVIPQKVMEEIRNFTGCLCLSCLKEMCGVPGSGSRALVLVFMLLGSFITGLGQVYPGPAGQAGSTALYADSSIFIAWAVDCKVTRGYQDISNTSLGLASVGVPSMACGKAQSNGVLSLGDGGSAICTFANPIGNGPGPDFAVFENSIDDSFLELAFVEVSSDGQNFFRFHSHSLTDTVNQTSGFGTTDATKLNNLAGKYRAGYGTPFDLQELAGTPGLNISAITHVKVVDVVGSLNTAYATRDFFGNKVNDPWPTPFPSSGFDLDAIGVISQGGPAQLPEVLKSSELSVRPTICSEGEQFLLSGTGSSSVWTLQGTRLLCLPAGENIEFGLPSGVYFLRSDSTAVSIKLVVY